MSTEDNLPKGLFQSIKIQPINTERNVNYCFSVIDLPMLTDDNGEKGTYTVSGGIVNNKILGYTFITPPNFNIKDSSKFVRVLLPLYLTQFEPNDASKKIIIDSVQITGTLNYNTPDVKKEIPIDSKSTPVQTSGLVELPGKPTLENALPEDYAIRYKYLDLDLGDYEYDNLGSFLVLFCKAPQCHDADNAISQYLNVTPEGQKLICNTLLKGSESRFLSQHIVAAQVVEVLESNLYTQAQYKEMDGTLISINPPALHIQD